MSTQIVLNITGDELKADIREVLDAMTAQDKQKLVADIAHKYFVESMLQKKDGYSWNSNPTHATEFMTKLADLFGKCVREEIVKSTIMQSTIQAAVQATRDNVPVMVQKAVDRLAMGMLSGMLKVTDDTQQQQFVIDSLVQKLDSIGR